MLSKADAKNRKENRRYSMKARHFSRKKADTSVISKSLVATIPIMAQFKLNRDSNAVPKSKLDFVSVFIGKNVRKR